jgi:hypothetical protein
MTPMVPRLESRFRRSQAELDCRDGFVSGHSVAVGKAALRVARTLDVAPDDLPAVTLGAPMHDGLACNRSRHRPLARRALGRVWLPGRARTDGDAPRGPDRGDGGRFRRDAGGPGLPGAAEPGRGGAGAPARGRVSPPGWTIGQPGQAVRT